jgi:hypothetical protein
MNKFKQLFENLAKKAGVDITEAEYLKLTEALKEIDVSDEIATKLESNLYDIESAKQNYNLKSHFTALGLNGVDAQMREAIEELIEDDNIKGELFNIKSTPARVKSALLKIKELESLKSKADIKGDDGKAKKAQDEIDRLVSEFKTKELNYQSEISKERQAKFDMLAGYKEDLLLNSFKYATELPSDVNVMTAKQLINRSATEQGAKIKFNIESGKFELKSLNDDSLDFLDVRNNKPSHEDFVKGVLTQNKLLAVTDSNAIQTQTAQPFVHQQANGYNQVDTSAYDALQIP